MSIKKGEISTSFVIGTILTIAGFVILLFIFSQFFSFGQIDREVCHTSIILRATLPEIAQKYVPLKCPTQKICITSDFVGGGSCEEFENDKNVLKIRVPNSEDESSLRKIEKIYADETLACWTTMGEGKVDVFPNYILSQFGIGVAEPSCMICSRIAVDEESFTKVDLSKINVIGYMEGYKVPGKEENYISFISNQQYSAAVKIDQTSDLGEIEVKKLVKKEDKEGNTIYKFEKPGDDGKNLDVEPTIHIEINKLGTDTNEHVGETAVIFTQISAPEGILDVFTNNVKAITGVAATSFVIAPIMTVRALPVAFTYWTAAVVVVAGVFQAGSVTVNRAISASYCGDVTTSPEKAKKGCSVVRNVNYDIDKITEYCSIIESIP